MLQETVGKTSGRSADIQACLVTEIDSPVLQCSLKLQAATTHVAEVVPKHSYVGIRRYRCARFFDPLSIHQHFAGQNECLRAFAGRNDSLIDQQFIDPNFQLVVCLLTYASVNVRLNSSATYFFRFTESLALVHVQCVEHTAFVDLTHPLFSISTKFSTAVLKNTSWLWHKNSC